MSPVRVRVWADIYISKIALIISISESFPVFVDMLYSSTLYRALIKTLKVEEVYLNEYGTFEDAYRIIGHFIEKVYNGKRLHLPSIINLQKFEMELP